MDSEKDRVMARKLWLAAMPSTTLLPVMLGGVLSRTSSTLIGAVVVTLPPVSVARTASVTVLPPLAAMLGNAARRSQGKATSLLTTLPFTSTSTLRTCTSSLMAACSSTVLASCT